MEQNKKIIKKPKKFQPYWIYAIILAFFLVLQIYSMVNSNVSLTNWNDISKILERGDIDKFVVVDNKEAMVYLKEEALDKEEYKTVTKPALGSELNKGPHYKFLIGSVDSFEKKLNDFKTAKNISPDDAYVEYTVDKSYFGDLFAWLLPIGIILFFWYFIMRKVSSNSGGMGGGQIFNIGKSKAKLFDENTEVKITFKDVAGLEGPKEEVMEIVHFLKNPKKYTDLGGKIPKGALLIGPPGTGKTLLAKAMAGEAKVPFFSLSGSDFVEMFVGVGASRVRDLFKQSKEKAPCIIFIDEIDAIGRTRGKNQVTGANDERENTLNQLLTEMDGFDTNINVIIIAATNRVDVLDKALIRPGRFDRQIYVDLPEIAERIEIFKVHLKPLKLGNDIDIEFLAKQTPGFSGADIANVCNESALIAARKNKKSVGKQDFLDAVDRIIGGFEKKSKIISKSEKKAIAYHEAGHATVSWLLEHAAPLVKVTIVPRGQALGAAWYLPEERQLTNVEQMNDEICATLGGRAAEKVIFNKISTGALSDLEKVTKQAMAMVTIYGLNDKLGNITYYDSSGNNDYSFNKPYSEKTAQLIDEEIKQIIEFQYQRAIKLLEDNKEDLTKLANKLLEKEVIFKEDLEKIFGKRKYEKEELPTKKTLAKTTSRTKKTPAKSTKTTPKTSKTTAAKSAKEKTTSTAKEKDVKTTTTKTKKQSDK